MHTKDVQKKKKPPLFPALEHMFDQRAFSNQESLRSADGPERNINPNTTIFHLG